MRSTILLAPIHHLPNAEHLAAARLTLERSRTAAVDAAATASALAGSLGRQLRDTTEHLSASEASGRALDDAVKSRQRELEGANAQIKVTSPRWLDRWPFAALG